MASDVNAHIVRAHEASLARTSKLRQREWAKMPSGATQWHLVIITMWSVRQHIKLKPNKDPPRSAERDIFAIKF